MKFRLTGPNMDVTFTAPSWIAAQFQVRSLCIDTGVACEIEGKTFVVYEGNERAVLTLAEVTEDGHR